MELRLLHEFFWNFSMQGERYYFCMEGSMSAESACKVGWSCEVTFWG